MLTTGKTLTKDEAKEYRKSITLAKLNGGGCIATLPCDNCGILVTDSICLCVGCFMCPACGHENGTKLSDLPPIVKYEWYYDGDILKSKVINE